ncbi:hypothetical protein SLEP1_g44707 [Rubroshorea leprosula]|uniref:Uncharacterized protein n=1 Tax=Rubroshorea leprosula TaxID=152421 RepID=A0AAV5LH01_9ROSI|nr:hypothetical protein SLEP1_g44707 [Rubroshorea leprosula]
MPFEERFLLTEGNPMVAERCNGLTPLSAIGEDTNEI